MSFIRRIICFVFMIMSLIAIIGTIIFMSDIASSLNVTIDFESLMEMIGNSTINELLYAAALMIQGIFLVLGTPIIIFLVSLIGLTNGKKLVKTY